MNARGQIKKSFRQGPPRRKRLPRISGECRPDTDSRRLKSKLVSLDSRGTEVVGNGSSRFFPGERLGRPPRRSLFDHHFTTCLHHQFLVQLLNGEKTEQISKVVHPFRARRRGWLDAQLAARDLVVRQRPRLEAGHVISYRYRVLVFVRSSMTDPINHWPIVMGRVRAWLKYLLDKLFDHEGRSRSSSLRNRSSRESPSEPFVAEAPGNGYFNSRKSKPRNNASASRIACKSSNRSRGSFW